MRLRRSAVAKQDLLDIWAYIAQDSPAAADRVLLRFEERFDSLQKSPLTGESQDRYRYGLRSAIEGNYVIFYESRGDEILIYRVLHRARKWENLLSDRES